MERDSVCVCVCMCVCVCVCVYVCVGAREKEIPCFRGTLAHSFFSLRLNSETLVCSGVYFVDFPCLYICYWLREQVRKVEVGGA